MATIPSTTNALRHVRKTISFDGSANNGNLGDRIPAFQITGRVRLRRPVVAYVSSNLVGTALSLTEIAIITTSSTTNLGFIGADALTVGLWDLNNTAGAQLSYPVDSFQDVDEWVLAEDIEVNVGDLGGGADITGGVLIIDCWYYPVTDDGALAGDDIDAGYMPADVKAWLATAAATPTVAGVPEVDVTHFGGTAGTFASGIPETKVASIAAAAITAAAIATDAIDADALAADALTEIFTKVLTTALTESYNADGAAPTLAQAIFLLIGALTEFAISGTTLTVKKLDGTTTAATYTLDSATAPTSRTRAT